MDSRLFERIENLLNKLHKCSCDLNNTLGAVQSQLNNYDTNVGDPTDNTLRVVLENNSRSNLIGIQSSTDRFGNLANWTKTPGNSIEYTWAANPLNPSSIVMTVATFKIGLTTHFIQTYTYDANDNVTSIVVS